MKRLIIALLAALCLSSCSWSIVPERTGPESLLCLNARLYTGDTLHTAYVHYSGRSDISPAVDATLDCYVNGIKAASSGVSEDGTCTFRAGIQPGDTVRLVVISGAGTAEAVAVGLPAPSLQAAKLSGRVDRGQREGKYDYLYGLLSCSMKVSDEAGTENYYAAELLEEDILHELGSGARLAGRVVKFASGTLFSDQNFPGGSATVEAEGRLPLKDDMRMEWAGVDIIADGDYEKACFLMRSSVVARVCALTAQDWWTSFYLLGNSWDGINNAIQNIGRQNVYPQNVKGGMGLVTVRSCSDIRLPLAETQYGPYLNDVSQHYIF